MCPRDIEALLKFINCRQNMPHQWGSSANDCVSFVAGAVKAQTGENPTGKRKWSSLKGALKAIEAEGGMEAALDKRFKRIPPAHAMRGDIAGVTDETFGIHPAIVEGLTLVGPGEKGNRRFPRKAMIAAWSAVKP